jgi:hypothetical protein
MSTSERVPNVDRLIELLLARPGFPWRSGMAALPVVSDLDQWRDCLLHSSCPEKIHHDARGDPARTSFCARHAERGQRPLASGVHASPSRLVASPLVEDQS